MKNSEKKNAEELSSIADACLRAYHITLSHFDERQHVLLPCIPPTYDFNLFTSIDQELLTWVIETRADPLVNSLYTSSSSLTWMYIHTPFGGLYLGPVFFSAPSRAFLKEHGLKEISLPVMDFLEFSRLCNYLYILLNPGFQGTFSHTIFQNDYETALTEDEMARIAKLDKNKRYYNMSLKDAAKAYLSLALDFDAQK